MIPATTVHYPTHPQVRHLRPQPRGRRGEGGLGDVVRPSNVSQRGGQILGLLHADLRRIQRQRDRLRRRRPPGRQAAEGSLQAAAAQQSGKVRARIHIHLQGVPCPRGLGFVDLELACSTILLGQ